MTTKQRKLPHYPKNLEATLYPKVRQMTELSRCQSCSHRSALHEILSTGRRRKLKLMATRRIQKNHPTPRKTQEEEY